MHRRLNVRVRLQRDRDVSVAQMLLHHPGMDAVGKGDRRPRVSQAVRRKVRHLVLANPPLECLVDTLGVQRAAVGFAEDVVLINETGSNEEPLLEHPSSMIAEDAHGEPSGRRSGRSPSPSVRPQGRRRHRPARPVVEVNRYLGEGDAGSADVTEIAGDALTVIESRPAGVAWLLDGLWRQLGVDTALAKVLSRRRFTTDVDRL